MSVEEAKGAVTRAFIGQSGAFVVHLDRLILEVKAEGRCERLPTLTNGPPCDHADGYTCLEAGAPLCSSCTARKELDAMKVEGR